MEQVRHTEKWYTRREGVVRGPFNADEVSRYFLLGRICREDEISQDRQTWMEAQRCTELLPAELQQLSGWEDYQQLVIARMQADERKGERRSQDHCIRIECYPGRRKLPNRRSRKSERLAGAEEHAGNRGSIRPLLLTLLLATMIFAWLLPAQR